MFIEGGTFSMGRVEQDVMYEWNNVPRRVTVSSFYLEEPEGNTDYLEYLYWLEKKRHEQSYLKFYTKFFPTIIVSRDKLGYNEPYVTQYLRHPS